MSEQVTDEFLNLLWLPSSDHPIHVRRMAEELLLWRTLGSISEKDGRPDIEINHDGDGNYTCPICGESLGNEDSIDLEGYLRSAGMTEAEREHHRQFGPF